MANSMLPILLLVLMAGQVLVAEYNGANDETSSSVELVPSGPQLVLGAPQTEPGRAEASQYAALIFPSQAESRQRDINRLLGLYKAAGLRAPHLKRRLFEAGNQQPFVELDDPHANLLGLNRWGADEGSENHLSSKKADSRPLDANSLRRLLEANFRSAARKKKSRCVADDSRGVKNPSFCDMDAYFGAAGYRSDLWDNAGRR